MKTLYKTTKKKKNKKMASDSKTGRFLNHPLHVLIYFLFNKEKSKIMYRKCITIDLNDYYSTHAVFI